MKYHQSEKKAKSHRVTALKKVDDKYNYDNVNFPASVNDIEQFETNNNVSVFVYSVNDKDEIFREKLGNPDHFNNDVIYLLRLDMEEKSHYIYIKHLERLFNLNRIVSKKDQNYCPYCEKHCEDNMSDHIKKCYKLQFNDGALLKLPPNISFNVASRIFSGKEYLELFGSIICVSIISMLFFKLIFSTVSIFTQSNRPNVELKILSLLLSLIHQSLQVLVIPMSFRMATVRLFKTIA